ncbi:hypothetical protein O181_003260 [Austropuccinia psidii MF-1]|uniref:Retrotransposon gag domain-containing protein n=1 Tax=Austropuccinia psidii MF-1 TaxID=1389203 RepID=A0A9Q3BEM8_9BASI|nr:hypothetical protein [Austropuccinia psidii MF-1]
MPVQHSPPATQTRSQARAQAVYTITPRAPVDGSPAVPQLRAHLDRGPNLEGEAQSRKEGRGPRIQSSFSGVVGSFPGISSTTFKVPGQYGEEEESDGTEGVPFPHMTHIMANLQEASSHKGSRPPAFKTPCMKAPKCFDGTQPFKVINFSQKAEVELDALRMKEGGHVSLYISDFGSLVSRMGDWGEKALIHNVRKGLASRVLDQLASHPSRIDSLQDLMDITLELDTRYHERKKEKSNFQEKNPEASKSVSFNPQNSSSSNQKKNNNFNFQKRDTPRSSFLNNNFNLMEFWDEEEEPEEIEKVMKVAPSPYHHYLDVFSKVKEEELPPHCARDHHIKLEELLPPVGVIYSLSNQESDTIMAYISEHFEKGFIQPSSSSTGAPVLVSKRRIVASVCVLLTKNSILLLGRTNILFLP